MKLFKFFITVVSIATLANMMLDAAKNPKRKNSDQEHDSKQSKKARKEDDKKEDKYERNGKVDIDTALIKQEQKKQEHKLVLPHTLLPYIVISKIDKHVLPDDILYTIFEFLNPRDEKEFHQLLARLTRSSGKAGPSQLKEILRYGFFLSPSGSIKYITLPEVLKNKAPEAGIHLLLRHCDNYLLTDNKSKDFQKLGEVYSLAVEHKNLDQKIIDELKSKFLDALKDEKNDYNATLVGTALEHASHKGYLPALQALIQNNLLSDNQVGSVLMKAIEGGHLPVVQELLHNPLVNALLSDEDVCPAFMSAAHYGDLPIVQEFLSLINDPATSNLLPDEFLREVARLYIQTQEIKEAIHKARSKVRQGAR